MKIEQKPKFQPITIMLETREEAEIFWDLISMERVIKSGKILSMGIELSNWFSNNAQL